MTENPYGQPLPDLPEVPDESSVKLGQASDTTLPKTIDEFQFEPVSAELTLLSGEPRSPTVMSQREHARHLLGQMRTELTETELYETFMQRAWVHVIKMALDTFNDFIDERIDARYLSQRGIREPEDICQAANYEALIEDLWSEWRQKELFVGVDRYDRILAEEAARSGTVHWGYLRQLPTEPEYDSEEYELSQVRVWLRTTLAQDQTQSRLDPEKGAQRPVPPHGEINDRLEIIRGPGDKIRKVFALARTELSEDRFYHEFVPRAAMTLTKFLIYDMDEEFCCVADHSDLAGLGIVEPEHLFHKDRLASGLTDIKDFYFQMNAHLGSNHNHLGDLAQHGFNLISFEEKLNL